MKVSIVTTKGNWDKANTGKGFFAQRLMRALKDLGVKVTDRIEPCDIALHIGRIHYASKAKKDILRVGPACVSTHMNYRKINAEKWQSVKKPSRLSAAHPT